jgi:hypothetical protein
MSHGAVLIDEDFVVGEAVDEAAAWMEEADGAFIWLTPSAVNLYNTGFPERIAEGSVTFEYEIPLKGGRKIRTLAVNPVAGYPLGDSASQVESLPQLLAKKMSLAFERPRGNMSVDVMIKKQNTEAFLNAATAHWTAIVDREAALRRQVWGGVDPLEDPTVLDGLADEK